MAVEKLFFSIRQDQLVRASARSEESTQLLREGKLEEAEGKGAEVNEWIGKAKVVDDVLRQVLERFEQAGIPQPPVEYLRRLVASQVEVRVPRTPVRADKVGAPKKDVAPTGGAELALVPGEHVVTVDGRKIPLSTQRWELLSYLHVSNNWCDSRELREIFGDGFRDTLGNLREQLGESPDSPRFIQSERVPGTTRFQYRLVLESREEGKTVPSTDETGGRAPELTEPPPVALESPQPPQPPAAPEPVMPPEGELGVRLLEETDTAVVDGKEIVLGGAEWQILKYLHERKGEWCDVNQIMQAVWGREVRINYLQTHIWGLRRKLGESARQPRFIYSAGRKYMFSTEILPKLSRAEGRKKRELVEQGPPMRFVLEKKVVVINGKEIALRDKVWSLAEYLRRKGEQWSDPEELRTAVGGQYLQVITTLRKALGESRHKPRFLQAQRILGSHRYRFRFVNISGTVGRRAPEEKQLSSLRNQMPEVLPAAPSASSVETPPQGHISEPEVTADEELGEDGLRLTDEEVYVFAKALKQADLETLVAVGIGDVHAEDKAEMRAIVDRHVRVGEKMTDVSLVREKLMRKLHASLGDKKGMFLANAGSEDAQFLLALLARVDSGENLEKLLSSN